MTTRTNVLALIDLAFWTNLTSRLLQNKYENLKSQIQHKINKIGYQNYRFEDYIDKWFPLKAIELALRGGFSLVIETYTKKPTKTVI